MLSGEESNNCLSKAVLKCYLRRSYPISYNLCVGNRLNHTITKIPWDPGGWCPACGYSWRPPGSVWQILCTLSLLEQTHLRWLCQTVPHPQYYKKQNNELFVIVLLFLTIQWRDTSHSSRCHTPRRAGESWDSWGSSWCPPPAPHSVWRETSF